MHWKTIGGRRDLYRSMRDGDKVRTEYLGTGERAALFALLDAEDRAERLDARQQDRRDAEAEAAGPPPR
jgi:hypothetical protein